MVQKLIGLTFLLVSVLGFCQSYTPTDTADYVLRKNFLIQFKKDNDIYVKSLKSRYSGKTALELEKFYKEFYKSFEKEVKNKDFSFNSPFQEKVNALLNEIKKSNSQLPTMRVLISKDNAPNAYCLADGTFVVNMGLFNWMDNSDQIVSVLCHEIAHNVKEHSLKGIVGDISEYKDYKEKIRGLNAMKEGKTDKAFDMMKSRLYKKLGTKRKNEIQADSLGFVLFSKTSFKKAEFMNSMKNLQEFDSISPREIKEETYKKLYNLPNLPFNEKWMKKEDFSLYNYDLFKEKMNKDSLSTHPEIQIRIATLEQEFPILRETIAPDKSNDEFKKLKSIARREILPNFYHSEDYGMGIYSAMHFLQDEEDEEYSKMWLGKFFQKIYEARKNYNLNRYLDRVEPKNHPESYQQFLNFMWNLKIDEIQKIADFYTKKES